ncbi:GPI-anchored cell wall beta-1,3-endoglucanase EglC [Metarhizium album ARSEF 1941]|uniref:GPI-anchored cell wall beta-1,3-endoglucanase EglC n=1 Tax=Metarhizium album (strain ARSEF 1941) TaxID=1081103 RepID=A0A0B2WNF0_METAS|nr:GPI-anchored cell wall beta-1,3-endoglucanase EglC [Metarhizium album ARSEF 1941]KHN95017.1 GPI-anchored cell wall beta-1,3-endoglucanase EglC [Metarhizium album ARSEF 1941]
MHLPTTVLTGFMAMGASAASNYLGFNSGATLADRSAKFKKDFVDEMKAAQGLTGAPGTFNAVRLYTNIQAYSQDDPIEAFEAAIETGTKLLLGVWASGTDNIDKEISALHKAETKYGTKFTDTVIGISIGSEDLYRDSVTGNKNKAGVGNSPATIVKFIETYKKAFKDSALGKVPVGHVDTWDSWTNTSAKMVIDALDWVGVDEYPFYENGKSNGIDNAGSLFDRAYEATIAAVGGKPVWVTETGWPTTGPNWDQAVPSVENAKTYWDEVGCRQLFNKVPTFWYNIRDSNPDNKVKFAITKDLSTKPLFDLTCPKTFKSKARASSNSSSADSTASFTASGSSKPTSTGGAGSPGSDHSNGSGTSGGSKTNADSGSSTAGAGGAASTTAKGASSTVEKFSGAVYLALAVVAGSFALL